MKRKSIILALAAAGLISTGSAHGSGAQPSDRFAGSAPILVATSAGDNTASTSAASSANTAAPIPLTSAPDWQAIFKRYSPAVVNITIEGSVAANSQNSPDPNNDPFFRFFHGLPIPQQPQGRIPVRALGSGFIIAGDGLILTNAHVVRDAQTVTVKLSDRREYKAKVLGVDPTTDIAVIRIDAHDLPTVVFGDPSKLHVGDYVLAIGSPFGFSESATAGIVSAKGRSLPGDSYVPFIQTDVAVNPGNSGGPLFDAAGQVVGINSQIYSSTGGYEGLSFAIPIDVALGVKDQILKTGHVQHARLGVTVQELDQGLAESFKLDNPNGALVTSVTPGSAADKAGLRPGDVVLSMNGKPIEHSSDLAAMVGSAKPGDKVTLKLMRDGKPEELTALLGEAPNPLAKAEQAPSNNSEARLGIAVRPLTPEEKRASGLKSGLVVEGVTGAAELAGIEPGDVILSINGQSVNGVDQLRNLLKKDGKYIALLVQRGDARIFVPVQIG